MNILVDQLPAAIEIKGKDYRINSDFRNCLQIISAFEDPKLASLEKQTILIQILFVDMPEDLSIAVEKGLKFLNCGEDSKNTDPNDAGDRLYSFEKDANFIFSAFQQTHGINLKTAQLHWWEFVALFMDLGSETTFSSLISLRKRLKTGKATKEERIVASEIREIVDLPDTTQKSLEERESEAQFLEQIRKAKERRENARKKSQS